MGKFTSGKAPDLSPEGDTGIWFRINHWLNQRGVDLRDLFGGATLFGFLYGQVDRRLSVNEILQSLLKKPVPAHAYQLLCLGGIAFFLFIVQAVTGTLLAVYYRPAPGEAYASIQYIVTNVRLGWLIRQVHAWGANLMVLAVFLHLFNVYLRGAYKHPRELNWMAGVFLLFLTLTFGFTGFLLPWDSVAYWGSAVGTGVLGHVPFLGKFLLLLFRGEEAVGGATLSRFYALHVIILPWTITLFLAAHFLMVRRLGISDPL